MGGMIACKLAATYPNRVLSLALLNVTSGGYECFPRIDGLTLSIAMRFLRAKTPEQRAAVDLDTHYSQEYLEEYVGLKTRRDILYQDYVKWISASGMQSNHRFDGQINACWTHKVSKTELEVIREEGFLISIIHGRYDVIAQIPHAQKLAEKLYPLARMVELPRGHLVSHERTKEISKEPNRTRFRACSLSASNISKIMRVQPPTSSTSIDLEHCPISFGLLFLSP
ncbi:alpha/beta hydrolase fold-1 [Tanacetum coccineum]